MDVVASVRRVLDLPDDELDYASAKIAFNSLIDPEFDQEAVFRKLDQLTIAARALAKTTKDRA